MRPMNNWVVGTREIGYCGRSSTWSWFMGRVRKRPPGPSEQRALAALIPAPLYVLLSILLVQIASATAKTVISPVNLIGLVFLRNLLGAVLLCIVVRPSFASFTRAQWANVLCL